jgi:hypothetical protein
MKRFALAYANLFDNEIKIHIFEGETALSVATAFLSREGYELHTEVSLEALKETAFNSDALLEVIEIPSTTTSDE